MKAFQKIPSTDAICVKRSCLRRIKAIALDKDIEFIAEASNIDDNGDYRPGLQAVQELGILSPLRTANLKKAEIRQLSKALGLKTWNKQSFACLSSRFPYGESITPERLSKIDKAEQFLLDLGFHQVRVRYHGNLARIETDENGFTAMLDGDLRHKFDDKFREIGFTYVTLDIKGYRTGSMNETLNAANS